MLKFLDRSWIWDYGVPALLNLLGLALVVVIFSGLLYTLPISLFFHNLDNQAHDRMLRWSGKKPYMEDLHFVAIDRSSYEPEVGSLITEEEVQRSEPLSMLTGNFPWNRAVWGHAIERLIEEGGADVVVLDLLLPSPSEGDDYLKRVLEEHREDVVVGSRIDRQDFGGSVMESFESPTESVLGENAAEEAYRSDPDGRVGHVNVWPDDRDGVVRNITYQYRWHNDKLITALSARALRKSRFEYDPPDRHFTERIRYSGPPSTYPPNPIYELFVDRLWESNYVNTGAVEGDIVVIGPYGNWQQDYKRTPISDHLMPGPELHLNAISALKERAFLDALPDVWGLYLALFLGILAPIMLFISESTPMKALLFLAGAAAYLAVVFALFERSDLVVPVVFPMLAYTGNGLTTFLYQYIREQREKNRIRGTLDRYISSDVASEILEDREDYFEALGGERKEVTVLFSDIRSFTPISEELSSERLVTQLNEYLTPMTEIIQGRKGRLDKFIGDAVMAVWGDLFDRLSPEEEVAQAVRAALEMLERTEELSEGWEAEGYPPFEIGIGINRGRTVFGNLGSESRMEMTVIGDAVNQAARFEGLTKTYGIRLIVGEEVYELLPDDVVAFHLDRVRVKGKTEPTEVYGVLGFSDSVDDDVLDELEIFRSMREAYADARFDAALKHAEELLDSERFGDAASHYRGRLEELRADPPEDWNGVWVMTSK